MKYILILFAFFFFGCSVKEVKPKKVSTQQAKIEQQSNLKSLLSPKKQKKCVFKPKKTKYVKVKNNIVDNYDVVLKLFIKNCRSKKAKKIYGFLCQEAKKVKNPQTFFQTKFDLYKIVPPKKTKGLLTGYYEPLLYGSYKKTKRYLYPLYSQPKDLLEIHLEKIFPELKRYHLRGRLVGNKVVPYYERSQQSKIKAKPICYVDSRIDRFFLEIQGSGRVILPNKKVICVGYKNQNGYKYRSIGRYMIKKGYLKRGNVSLKTIKQYLKTHPHKVDEILHYNKSMIFFQKKSKGATGSLGIVLTPYRSIAVDRKKIPLGSMLYIQAKQINLKQIVFAQDTGGAIEGDLRADLFTGYGKKAEEIAGNLQSPLEMWLYLPKKRKK